MPRKSTDALRQAAAERARARRAAIKNDPIRHELEKEKERQRWAFRKQSGKIKSVSEMNAKEKAAIRKRKRECTRRYRNRLKNEKESDPGKKLTYVYILF